MSSKPFRVLDLCSAESPSPGAYAQQLEDWILREVEELDFAQSVALATTLRARLADLIRRRRAMARLARRATARGGR